MIYCCVLTYVQTAAAADEVLPLVPPADPPQRAHLSAVQSQESLEEPQETQEEIVPHVTVRPYHVSSLGITTGPREKERAVRVII